MTIGSVYSYCIVKYRVTVWKVWLILTPLKLCIPKMVVTLCTRNANGSSSKVIYGLCKLNRNNGIMHTEATKTPDVTILLKSSSVNNFSNPS